MSVSTACWEGSLKQAHEKCCKSGCLLLSTLATVHETLFTSKGRDLGQGLIPLSRMPYPILECLDSNPSFPTESSLLPILPGKWQVMAQVAGPWLPRGEMWMQGLTRHPAWTPVVGVWGELFYICLCLCLVNKFKNHTLKWELSLLYCFILLLVCF